MAGDTAAGERASRRQVNNWVDANPWRLATAQTVSRPL